MTLAPALPAGAFRVTFKFAPYVCVPAPGHGSQDYDCSSGTVPTRFSLTPALYCSGYADLPSCSTDWYPDELTHFNIVKINFTTYLCSASNDYHAEDEDCVGYHGGDPALASGAALKCSTINGGVSCLANYYPSEMEGVTVIQLGVQKYLCKQQFGRNGCYKWDGYSSPRSAMSYGQPSVYCDTSGVCTKAGF